MDKALRHPAPASVASVESKTGLRAHGFRHPAGEQSSLVGAPSSGRSLAGAGSPGEWTSCLGSAKPIACDGPEGRPRRGGREQDNRDAEEDGTMQFRSRGRESLTDQRRAEGVRAGARPAGASQGRRPGAIAGRGAAQRRRLDLYMARFGNAARMRGCCRGLPCCSRLSVWPGFALGLPWSLVVPVADGRWPPDGFPADPAVGAGHLATGDVSADGGGRDAEEARDVACCPPVSRERLRHAAQVTALTLLGRG
jgi:hypothetical protein